jgi:hypothetical protein
VHLADVDGGVQGFAKVHHDVGPANLCNEWGCRLLQTLNWWQSAHQGRQGKQRSQLRRLVREATQMCKCKSYAHPSITWKSPVKQSSSTSATAAPYVK